MDEEDNDCGILNEKTTPITERQAEYLELFLECRSTRAVAELAGVTRETVAAQLNKVAKSKGMADLRQLLGKAEYVRANPVRSDYQERQTRTSYDRPTTSRLMQLIEDQEYRCALSGVELTPEEAALDHKVPVSNGGSDELHNLHWVSNDINRAKGTMSNDEFIQMCKRVASWCR
jgi:5-methylcytosine-specific restriction endonuclease McrA